MVATRVCLAYIHPGDTAGCFTESLGQTLILDGGRHINTVIGMQASPRIAAARCEMVSKFLEMNDDWLWFVDADMAWTPDMAGLLFNTAHKDRTPVLGGLCFAGGRSYGETGKPKMWPTIYELIDAGGGTPGVRPVKDYARDQLVQVGATGAAFILIHRKVLEKMAKQYARGPDGLPNPYPWFSETVMKGQQYGEDVTFCLRAQACGFPVFVHTGVKVKHRKAMYLDQEMYDEVEADLKAAEQKQQTHIKLKTPLVLPNMKAAG